jgi:ABC-2 type transport system ATP-binding protein
MTVLRLSNISYAFGKRKALKDVSFTAAPGQVTMMLGTNGAGKTTLFSLIAGLLALQAGTVQGRPKNMGIVFQQPALDLELSVAQNLRYYASLHGMSASQARRRIEEVLELLGLAGRSEEVVRNFNGGHRRRVEIARALLTDPELLLLDEPTAGLDMLTRKSLVNFLHEQARARGICVLWATHLADEVLGDDQVVILRRGEVAASGPVAQIAKGQNIAEAFALISQDETV